MKGAQARDIIVLNRVVAVSSAGLTYDADPRHTDLLMSSLNLTSANSSSTPGLKPHDRDDLAVKVNEPDSTALDDYSNPDATIAAICAAGLVGCEKRLEKHNNNNNIHNNNKPLTEAQSTQVMKACLHRHCSTTHGCNMVHAEYGHVNIQNSGGSSRRLVNLKIVRIIHTHLLP